MIIDVHVQRSAEMIQLYLTSIAVNAMSIRLGSLKSLSVYGLFIRPPGLPLTVILGQCNLAKSQTVQFCSTSSGLHSCSFLHLGNRMPMTF